MSTLKKLILYILAGVFIMIMSGCRTHTSVGYSIYGGYGYPSYGYGGGYYRGGYRPPINRPGHPVAKPGRPTTLPSQRPSGRPSTMPSRSMK